MSFSEWYQGSGSRYEARVGDHLWLDQGQYHARAPVEIRDRVTGEVLKRSGDVHLIGNFSPIWVSLYGRRVQVDILLRFSRPALEEFEEEERLEAFQKHGVTKVGPRDWLPPPKRKGKGKGKSMGDAMGADGGFGPFDGERASRFLEEIQESIAADIGRRIEPGTSASHDEAVAAAGLLHHLTSDAHGPGGDVDPIDLTAAAQAFGLFGLAVAALDRVLADEAWFESFSPPARKHAAVHALRDALLEKAAQDDGGR